MGLEIDQMQKRLDGAQTVTRAAQVLSFIGRQGVVRFSTIAKEVGLANPTVSRILQALTEARLVAHDKNAKLYRLGSESYVLGQLARPEFGFHDLARDSLTRLAQKSGDTAFLSALEGLSTVCLHREEGKYPIRTHVLNVGDRQPLGIGAASLAVLSALPSEQAEEILMANKELIETVKPEIEISHLKQLLEVARQTGVALNPGLVFQGSWALAVCIRAPDGRILGALTIAAVENRMTPERQKELATILVAEARRVEKLIVKFGPDGVQLGAVA